jgi:ABC-type multidrug transport system fused ATPase/permease subunit
MKQLVNSNAHIIEMVFCYTNNMHVYDLILKSYNRIIPILNVLSKKDKINLFLIIIVQTVAASLDIIGIFIVGILASLSSGYILGTNLNSASLSFINFFELSRYSLKSIIFILSLVALIFFISKSLISMTLNWKIFIYYSKKHFDYSSNLYSKLLNSSFSWLKRQKIEDVHMAIGAGSEAIFSKQISNLIMIISDGTLIIFILVFLMAYNFKVALFTFIFLLIVAIILQKVIGIKVSMYGKIKFENSMLQNAFVNMVLLAFREIFVLRKDVYFRNKFDVVSHLNSTAGAKALWIQQVPKYVFEIALVIGIFLLSLFLVATSIENVSILIVFIVAAGRLIPSFFRIQSGILGMKYSYPEAFRSVQFFNEIQIRSDIDSNITKEFLTNPPSIRVESLFFKFPDSSDYLLDDISITVAAGEVTAFVGRSGSGKTTLADLILNIYTPSKGKILLNDGKRLVLPSSVTNISCVTQNPIILSGTLIENIAIGIDPSDVNQDALNYSIAKAELNNLIKRLPRGLDTKLNNLTGVLSGGEKQRVAIARALYVKPKLLVVDEGTSSLDYTSEKVITNSLISLQGEVTTIIIAHRINTLKKVNNIHFIEKGKIIGSGNYKTLQNLIPEFGNWVEKLI